MNTVKRILDLFGISEAERNLVIWNTGVDFSRQFSHGEEMLKDEVFWDVWMLVFTSDDVAILKNTYVAKQPYSIVKDRLSTDNKVKRGFCRTYYGLKKASESMRRNNELDRLRKQLLGAIGGWLKLRGKALADPEQNMNYIKKVACQAAKKKDFNDIPKDRLRSLYGAFVQRQKDIKSVNAIN